MPLIHDFSNWPQSLYDFALAQFQSNGFLVYDKTKNVLSEAENANEIRVNALSQDRYAYWLWWLRFGTGFECLVKAVFLKHQISLLRKNDLSSKSPTGTNRLETEEAANVYSAVTSIRVQADSNEWLQSEFSRLNINHPLEINSGTFWNYRSNLHELTAKGLISAEEQQLIHDSIHVLSDIRRNVDAHVFLKSQTGGSINNDLTDVYIPVCNILIRVFQ